MTGGLLSLITGILLLGGPAPLSIYFMRQCVPYRSRNIPEGEEILIIVAYMLGLQYILGLLTGIMGIFTWWGIILTFLAVFFAGIMLLGRSGILDTFRDGLKFCQKINSRLAECGKFLRVFFLMLCLMALARILTSPTVSYDSLMYHMPAIGIWLQSGTLDTFDQWFYIRCYPYAWELLSALWMVISKSDVLLLLPSFIIWLYFALVIYTLCTNLSIKRESSINAVMVILPMFTNILRSLHVDVPLVVFFGATGYFALRFGQTRRYQYILPLLCTAMLLCAIKMSGPVYAVVAVIPGFLIYFTAVWTEKKFRAELDKLSCRWKPLALGLSIFLAAGGFWYWRNLLQLGNPLGFVKISVGKWLVFPVSEKVEEFVQNPHLGTLYNVFDLQNPYHYLVAFNALFMNFAFTVPIMFLAGLVLTPVFISTYMYRDRKKLWILAWLWGLFVLCFLLYIKTPFTANFDGGELTLFMTGQVRYALPAVFMLVIIYAFVQDKLPQCITKSLAVLSICLGLLRLFFPSILKWNVLVEDSLLEVMRSINKTLLVSLPQIVICILAGLFIWFLLRATYKIMNVLLNEDATRGSKQIYSLALALTTFTTVVFLGIVGASFENEKRNLYGEVIAFVNEHVQADETVGYLACVRPYFFYRRDFKNRVLYTPGIFETKEEWLRYLKKNSVTHVAIGSLPPWLKHEDIHELRWLEEAVIAGKCKKVFGEDVVQSPMIYSFPGSSTKSEGKDMLK